MKTLEHTAYAVDLSKNGIYNLPVQELEVVRQEELTFQLSERAETDPDETPQLDVPHPATSFGKIG